jgi:hypothetical protein
MLPFGELSGGNNAFFNHTVIVNFAVQMLPNLPVSY